MRELELFLRQYNAVRARSAGEGTPRRNVVDPTTPAHPFHGPVQAQQRRIDRPTFPIARQRLAILMTLSLMAAGLVTIVLATGF
jgi:hypothetical protein